MFRSHDLSSCEETRSLETPLGNCHDQHPNRYCQEASADYRNAVVTELKSEDKETKKKVEKLERQVFALLREKDELLEKKKELLHERDQTITKFKQDINRVQGQIQTCREDNRKLEEKLAHERQQNEHLEEQMSNQKRKLQEEQETLRLVTVEKRQLKETAEASERQIADLIKSKTEFAENHNHTDERVLKLSNPAATLQETIKQKILEANALESRLHDAVKKLDMMNEEKCALEKKGKTLRNQNESLKIQNIGMKMENKEVKQHIKALQAENTALKEATERREQQSLYLETELHDLQRKECKLNIKVSTLETDNKLGDESLSRLRQKKKKDERKLHTAEMEILRTQHEQENQEQEQRQKATKEEMQTQTATFIQMLKERVPMAAIVATLNRFAQVSSTHIAFANAAMKAALRNPQQAAYHPAPNAQLPPELDVEVLD